MKTTVYKISGRTKEIYKGNNIWHSSKTFPNHLAGKHLDPTVNITSGHQEVHDGRNLEFQEGKFRQVATEHVGAQVLEFLQSLGVEHGLSASWLLKEGAQVLWHSRRISKCW